MAYDDENIFAKILRGEIPAHKILENDQALAFLDVMPQAKGHALVIPKAPSVNLLDADRAVFEPVLVMVQQVARAALQAFQADGVVIQQFNMRRLGKRCFTRIFM